MWFYGMGGGYRVQIPYPHSRFAVYHRARRRVRPCVPVRACVCTRVGVRGRAHAGGRTRRGGGGGVRARASVGAPQICKR